MFSRKPKIVKREPATADAIPRDADKVGKLYFIINKDGSTRSNIFDWGRSYKSYKLAEFPTEYLESVKTMTRIRYDEKSMLDEYKAKPEVPTSKDCWVMSAEQIVELSALQGLAAVNREREMFAEWNEEQLKKNAKIKTANENNKKRRDEIISRGGDTRRNTIGKIIGDILQDMSVDSRRMVEGWKRPEPIDEDDEEKDLIADNLDEMYKKGDYLFLFEAAQATHLQVGSSTEETVITKITKIEEGKLMSMKHISGTYDRWLARFDDQLSVCESVGCEISDVEKRVYFMDNLNRKIFDKTLVQWDVIATRAAAFPKTYEGLKTQMNQEYRNLMQRSDSARVIAEVMYPKGNHEAGAEISLEAKEQSKHSGSGKTNLKCWICDKEGHIEKDCWYYDVKRTREESKAVAAKAIADKKAAKANKKKKGGEAAKREGSNKCAELLTCACEHKVEFSETEIMSKSAQLASEQCFVMGVKANEVDFVYDSGTVNGVTGEQYRNILLDVVEEPVLLEGIGGKTSLSKEYGDSIFGKTRILKHRTGSVLVSNAATKSLYQVVNPHEDLWILRGWDYGPAKGKQWHFIRDEERYGDPLLHCTLQLSKIKCLLGAEKFYDPPRVPETNDEEVSAIVTRVQVLHRKWSHATAAELKRVISADPEAAAEVTVNDIDIWKKEHGDFCTGCIEGSMREHDRVKSTKPLKATVPGEVGAADLMFIEGRADVKEPMYVHVDVATKCVIGVPMKNKTEEGCMEAIKAVQAYHRAENQELKSLVFDRESAIVALEPEILNAGVKLHLKAAGQKVGLAEVNIRSVRIKSRSTKAGVRELHGYLPANQFNRDLCLDSMGVLNRIPKEGATMCPAEAFTGRKTDFLRDFRADWGEPIIVKKPKGVSSDLKVTGEWAIVVRRIMNGSGVLKVYLVQSKKYAYRLKFQRAKAPDWVITALNSISVNSTIGFEDPELNPEDVGGGVGPQTDVVSAQAVEGIEPSAAEVTVTAESIGDESEQGAIEPLPGGVSDTEVEEAIALVDALDGAEELVPVVDAEPVADAVPVTDAVPRESRPVTRSAVSDVDRRELEYRAAQYAERVVMGLQKPEPEDDGRVVFDRKHRRSEANVIKAQEVIKRAYLERYQDREPSMTAVETTVESCGILYQQALKTRPEAATEALRKEVMKTCDKEIWHGVLWDSLTQEQKALVLPMMKNYVEKYHPDSTFDKSKVRVLIRGDLQEEIGEREGPVCRVESIMILLCIAANRDLEVFKVDISSAYMNTPVPADVKHRWVRLDKDVVQMLRELQPGKWDEFVQADGKMVVEMDKLMYGFKEAAHYWNVELINVFLKAGYKQCAKDKCVLVKQTEEKYSACAITVDDCLFVATKDELWINEQIEMLIRAFQEVTTERGNDLGIIGMQIKMDRENKRVILSQKKFAKQVIEVFGVAKKAVNPALGDLMGDDETSPLLADQRGFMSLNSLLMFGATRTYPETKPTVVRLSRKYGKATEADMQKARRVAEYIYGCIDDHVLILSPKSLQLIASSDASYAENPDGTSNNGGCVGFESDVACWLCFITDKQSVVAKSACEAELITVNKVGDMVEWARQLLEELGIHQETVVIQQDSMCSIAMLKQGTGSFKRAKHIKVRFFWLKSLIDEGLVVLKYVASGYLVADMLTKPVTGAKFGHLLYKLLGWTPRTTVTTV